MTEEQTAEATEPSKEKRVELISKNGLTWEVKLEGRLTHRDLQKIILVLRRDFFKLMRRRSLNKKREAQQREDEARLDEYRKSMTKPSELKDQKNAK